MKFFLRKTESQHLPFQLISTLVTHHNKSLVDLPYFHVTEKATQKVYTPKQRGRKILAMVPSDMPNICLNRVDYENINN